MERIVISCTGDRDPMTASGGDALQAEVVALVLDLGDGAPLEALRDRALAAGAVRAHVLDVREEYVRDYLLPVLRAGALAGDADGIEPALRRAITSRKLDEIARLERATPVASQATERSLEPPPRRAGVPPAQIDVSFERGTPTALNAIPMPLVDLFDTLATIAREHGVGRDRVAAVLQAAYASLTQAVNPHELLALARALAARYAGLVAGDLWESPAREALDAFFSKAQERVTGTVSMVLQNGEWVAVRVSAGGLRVQ